MPIVGQTCHYVRPGDDPAAALIVCVHKPDEVTVIWWSETGVETIRQFCPYVAPGQPAPKSDYVVPLPTGAPSAGATGS